MSSRISLVCLVVSVFLSTGSAADGDGPAEPATAALSGETRALLIREMQAIAAAMGRVHTAVVTGDHGTVASEAEKIHGSFVLAQEITEAQRQEIGSKLPPGFLAADRAFHQLAARLAEAGRHQDPRLERLWYEEMTRACQACHADYAAGRFPGLVRQTGEHGH